MALINGSQVSLPMAFGAVGSLIGVMPLFWGTAIVVASGAWFTRRAGREPPLDEEKAVITTTTNAETENQQATTDPPRDGQAPLSPIASRPPDDR